MIRVDAILCCSLSLPPSLSLSLSLHVPNNCSLHQYHRHLYITRHYVIMYMHVFPFKGQDVTTSLYGNHRPIVSESTHTSSHTELALTISLNFWILYTHTHTHTHTHTQHTVHIALTWHALVHVSGTQLTKEWLFILDSYRLSYSNIHLVHSVQ